MSALEALLERAGRPGEHAIDQLAFSRRPGRFIADEVADHPGIVAARAELLQRLALHALREEWRIHIGHAHDGALDHPASRAGGTRTPGAAWAGRQRVVELGAVGGVQAPGAHAPRRELCGRSTPVLAEAGLEVGDVERYRIAQGSAPAPGAGNCAWVGMLANNLSRPRIRVRGGSAPAPFTPADQKRQPSGSMSHQRAPICSTRKNPSPCVYPRQSRHSDRRWRRCAARACAVRRSIRAPAPASCVPCPASLHARTARSRR